jgi:ketosteroid isomerase-like protein
MKVWIVGFSSLVFLISASGCSQPPAASPPPAASTASAAPAGPEMSGDVSATITQLEHDWVTAITQKDVTKLDQLIADDFVGTSPSAHTYTKGLALDDLKSGRYVVDSMDLDEITVNTYGNVAIAFTSQQEKSRYDNADTSGHYHYTDVWLNRDGRWQVVASHGTRYEAALPGEH